MAEQDDKILTLVKDFSRMTWPTLAVAGSLGAFGVARHQWQQSQIFRHRSQHPDGPDYPAWTALPYEDVLFPSEDGTMLHGWWIEKAEPRATIVYCHGRSGSLAHRAHTFRRLHRLGFSVFAFDYRGYGRSSGQPSEQGLFADVRAAIDTATGEFGADPERLLLFGHSLGGAVAIDGAYHRPVAGLVVESSFTDLRDMARLVSGKLPLNLPVHLLARNAFRSVEKVPELEMPKLFIHGTADTTVPYQIGERLYAAAAEPKSWYAVEGADHEDLHRHDRRRYSRRLIEFIDRCVGR